MRDASVSGSPPIEGMLVRGQHGVDVGDEIEVWLLSTNPKRGFIDFGGVGDNARLIHRE